MLYLVTLSYSIVSLASDYHSGGYHSALDVRFVDGTVFEYDVQGRQWGCRIRLSPIALSLGTGGGQPPVLVGMVMIIVMVNHT